MAKYFCLFVGLLTKVLVDTFACFLCVKFLSSGFPYFVFISLFMLKHVFVNHAQTMSTTLDNLTKDEKAYLAAIDYKKVSYTSLGYHNCDNHSSHVICAITNSVIIVAIIVKLPLAISLAY